MILIIVFLLSNFIVTTMQFEVGERLPLRASEHILWIADYVIAEIQLNEGGVGSQGVEVSPGVRDGYGGSVVCALVSADHGDV